MTQQNNFQNFLSAVADSGKVGWVYRADQLIKVVADLDAYTDKEGYHLGKYGYISIFLKAADSLVPEGENPEWEKWFDRIKLTKQVTDVRKYETKRSVMIETLPQTHRLAVKHQIIDLFDQPDLDKAVDECINILSKFL